MKIKHHDTTAQLNASWYGKKTIKGTGYTKPVYRTKNYDCLKTFALALFIGLILLAVYLVRT